MHNLIVIIYLAIFPLFDESITIKFDEADGCLLELHDFILRLYDVFSSMAAFDKVGSIEVLIAELRVNKSHLCMFHKR